MDRQMEMSGKIRPQMTYCEDNETLPESMYIEKSTAGAVLQSLV